MIDNLAELPLFASLSRKAIQALIKDLPERKFKQGEYIIRQATPGTAVYLLLEGKVAVTAHSKEGVHTHILFHRAPSLFGDIEIWRERPYLGNVVALEPCATLVMDQKAFLRLLHSNHQACISMIQFLANQIYETGVDTRVRLFGKVEHLLANALCYFAVIFGEKREYGILLRKAPNKSELANMLGIARRSVIRGMESLEQEKLIQPEGGQLVIPDLAALRKKARENWIE